MIISRIAPTPNGDIHWGNLMNFVLTWVYIQQNSGELLLRFDDIDEARCDPKYTSHTKEILKFLGFNYSTELSNQTLKLGDYKSFLGSISHYTCSCSRQDIFKRTGGYYYDGFCRSRKLAFNAGENSIRFLSGSPRRDFVLWRKEDIPAYHLTSIKDDLDMKVSIVIRGEDLLESSQIQSEILTQLSMKDNFVFVHHRLLHNEQGQKLSKTRHDGDIYQRMQKGATRSEILNLLAQKMGLTTSDYTSLEAFINLDLNDYLVESFDRI